MIRKWKREYYRKIYEQTERIADWASEDVVEHYKTSSIFNLIFNLNRIVGQINLLTPYQDKGNSALNKVKLIYLHTITTTFGFEWLKSCFNNYYYFCEDVFIILQKVFQNYISNYKSISKTNSKRPASIVLWLKYQLLNHGNWGFNPVLGTNVLYYPRTFMLI